MPEFNGNTSINLFDIICEWLEEDPRTDWQFAPSRRDPPDTMLGSIWITHYVILHVYEEYVMVLYPYHSMYCTTVTIEAIHPTFFDDLHDIIVRAIA